LIAQSSQVGWFSLFKKGKKRKKEKERFIGEGLLTFMHELVGVFGTLMAECEHIVI